ncbi:hypothetical protein MUG91_G31n9 [Manis pentadactyla]|nr:hypothetical protein MUG91_G31n9 [Manis pentadactyla]
MPRLRLSWLCRSGIQAVTSESLAHSLLIAALFLRQRTLVGDDQFSYFAGIHPYRHIGSENSAAKGALKDQLQAMTSGHSLGLELAILEMLMGIGLLPPPLQEHSTLMYFAYRTFWNISSEKWTV